MLTGLGYFDSDEDIPESQDNENYYENRQSSYRPIVINILDSKKESTPMYKTTGQIEDDFILERMKQLESKEEESNPILFSKRTNVETFLDPLLFVEPYSISGNRKWKIAKPFSETDEFCFLNESKRVYYPNNLEVAIKYHQSQEMISSRLDWLSYVQSNMKVNQLSGEIYFPNIENNLKTDKNVGSGKYGTVCQISYDSNDSFPIAMKTIFVPIKELTIVNESTIIVDSMVNVVQNYSFREVDAIRLTSFLVENYETPHFSTFIGHSSNLTLSDYAFFILEEFADGDLNGITLGSRSQSLDEKEKRLERDKEASMISQVFSGLVAMALKYQMVHNDLHYKNVLFNICNQQFFYYHYVFVKNQKVVIDYYLPIYGKIFKIGDLGLASSGNEDITSRGFIPKHSLKGKESQNFEKAQDPNNNLNITYFPFINPYARDIWTFLSIFIQDKGNAQSPIKKWASYGFAEIFRLIKNSFIEPSEFPYQNTAFSTPIQLLEFISFMFNERTLLDSGLRSNIFSKPKDETSIKETFILYF